MNFFKIYVTKLAHFTTCKFPVTAELLTNEYKYRQLHDNLLQSSLSATPVSDNVADGSINHVLFFPKRKGLSKMLCPFAH